MKYLIILLFPLIAFAKIEDDEDFINTIFVCEQELIKAELLRPSSVREIPKNVTDTQAAMIDAFDMSLESYFGEMRQIQDLDDWIEVTDDQILSEETEVIFLDPVWREEIRENYLEKKQKDYDPWKTPSGLLLKRYGGFGE